MNIRDALIHGNFHQLKTHASEGQKKAVRESFHGNVWKFNLTRPNADPVLMQEINELEEIKNQGSFSWFLETSTGALFESVILYFKNRIQILDLIIKLHSLSFNETEYIFHYICIDGRKLSNEQTNEFINARKNHFTSEDEVRLFLDQIYSYLKT